MGKNQKDTNKEILSHLKDGVNEKIRYLFHIVNEHYEMDSLFFLQRHELKILVELVSKDNVYVSDMPLFMFNEKRFEAKPIEILPHADNLLTNNWQYVFYQIDRNKYGNLTVIGKIILPNEIK